MQYKTINNATGLVALAFLVGGMQAAHAVGTASGITISNSATVDYQVGGIDQSTLTSNTADFVVDNRVDLTVADLTATYVDVIPGSTAQVLAFTVTNTGNTAQDFDLAAVAGSDPYVGTDNFDATGVSIFVDNGDDAYNAADDTATFIDELAADGTATVFIVADIPVTGADGDIAAYTLTATAHEAGAAGLGAQTTATAGANDPLSVDVVLADGIGSTDGARDGSYSAAGAYRVASAALTVSKSVVVVSDPFNGTTDPKAIPGATMRYTIDVQNTSTTTAASNVVLVDEPPANTSYAAGTITLDAAAKTDGTGDDEADFNGTNANAVTVTIPTVAAGATATITFDVTID